ncbi:MAG: hypothetical protein AAB777_01290, partial [Patescibacteria group bacterium]
ISKAWHLDSNQEIIEDIYDIVKTKDQIFATIPANDYIRVTFEQILDNSRDITLFARATNYPLQTTNPSVEVYPVYDGQEGPKLDLVNDNTNPDFSSIDSYKKYRILLQNLTTPTDMFDLKIVGGELSSPQGIDFDDVYDPVTDRYWVGGTGSWSDAATHWAATSNGSPGAGNLPINGDNVIFDASSGTGTVTIDTASVSMLNVTESSANIIIATSTNGLTVTGDLYVAGTISGATAVTMSGADKTVSGGGTISAPLNLTGTTPRITSSMTFSDLTKTTTTADGIFFTAGTTQTIASGGSITLYGAASNLLSVSSSDSAVFTINFADATASYAIGYVSMSYVTASGQNILAINSTDGGNNGGITFASATSGTLRYWIAATSTTWNSTANWSTTSGGAGGSSVPTTTS